MQSFLDLARSIVKGQEGAGEKEKRRLSYEDMAKLADWYARFESLLPLDQIAALMDDITRAVNEHNTAIGRNDITYISSVGTPAEQRTEGGEVIHGVNGAIAMAGSKSVGVDLCHKLFEALGGSPMQVTGDQLLEALSAKVAAEQKELDAVKAFLECQGLTVAEDGEDAYSINPLPGNNWESVRRLSLGGVIKWAKENRGYTPIGEGIAG